MHYKNLYLFLFFIVAIFLTNSNAYSQSSADSLLDFIVHNKARSSLCLSQNDTTIATCNETQVMPLAGTVYLMIAVEFAKQAGSNAINEDTYIPISELDKYYIPNTGDSNYETWILNEKNKDHIINDSIKLVDVARGMMQYNCNANAEYLLDLLDPDNVKNNIQLFGLKNHTAIFPIVSSMFLYQNPKKLNPKDILSSIKKLNDEQYCKIIMNIHDALKYDSVLKPKFSLKDFTPKMQKLWSDRLPSATTKDYVRLCEILNNRDFLGDNSYEVVAEIIETAMEDPSKLTWLDHEGMKEGSTPWVFTKALYALTKEGTRIELACFFDDLTPEENNKLRSWINAFETAVLSDKNFRAKVAAALK